MMSSPAAELGWHPPKSEPVTRSGWNRTNNLSPSSAPASAPPVRTSPRFHHRQRSNSFSTASSPTTSLSPKSPAMSHHSPVSAVHGATPEPQRAVARPSSPHASRRRQTREENAPYTFGSCTVSNASPGGDEDEFVSMFEAGLGFQRHNSRRSKDGADSGRDQQDSSFSSTSEVGLSDEEVDEGDDELSIEDDQDGEWTPPHPIRSDSTQHSPAKQQRSHQPSSARPSHSALLGLRGQSTREPERHSHAGKDAGEAGKVLAVAGTAVKSANTLVSQDKARANWIQLWSVSPTYEMLRI